MGFFAQLHGQPRSPLLMIVQKLKFLLHPLTGRDNRINRSSILFLQLLDQLKPGAGS